MLKKWALISQKGHNPRSAIYYQCDIWASLLTSLSFTFLVRKIGRTPRSSQGCKDSLWRCIWGLAKTLLPQSHCWQVSGIYLFWEQSLNYLFIRLNISMKFSSIFFIRGMEIIYILRASKHSSAKIQRHIVTSLWSAETLNSSGWFLLLILVLLPSLSINENSTWEDVL